ncbi:low psii accumulation2 [Tasmannia lanceolata]|uniref:low psii accumulation2 n=1 Tax=Tasmannia lanceolata TaxID=3420 RepID=UPI004062A2C0
MEYASALAIQSPYLQKKTHLPLSLPVPTKRFFRGRVRVRAETEAEDKLSEEASVSTEKPIGFGSNESDKKKKKRKGERASVIRRSPIEKPTVLLPQGGDSRSEKENVNENAFLLTWLGLGFLIFVEGIALSASGFLPEEWDKFLVKYLYPSFTPTVFLFVGGTVVYGVLKYLQGEQTKS